LHRLGEVLDAVVAHNEHLAEFKKVAPAILLS
jgi:hypothetical protein